MSKDSAISIMGTGNVAWHLAHAFRSADVKVEYIMGRNVTEGQLLAQKVDAKYTANFNTRLKQTSLLLIAVNDMVVEKLVDTINCDTFIVAHTSGSLPLSVLDKHKNTGVFYPFQTFTKGVNTGKLQFPVCIEANTQGIAEELELFAKKVSKQVIELNSEKRKKLHLSGVLTNNFANHLFSRSFDFLDANHIESSLLIPILEETVAKLKNGHPKTLQTGPARRGDIEIIKKHLALLKAHPSLSNIYEVMSNSIIKYYH